MGESSGPSVSAANAMRLAQAMQSASPRRTRRCSARRSPAQVAVAGLDEESRHPPAGNLIILRASSTAGARRARRARSMKKLVLETTAPFQGLPELVAYDEGLFEQEGLAIEWADREQGVEKKVETHVTNPKGVDPFASHGKLFEKGKADMYNACEWGNYCRVQETSAGSRQVGRRAIVTYSALVVAPDSPVYTAQQLANRTIGVPFYFGTHYIALHMLEGFLRREEIKLCRAPNG